VFLINSLMSLLALRKRIRVIIKQVCDELKVDIISGVLSTDHVHMFVEIPPHVSISYFMQRVKGRSSRKIQQEFPDLKVCFRPRKYY